MNILITGITGFIGRETVNQISTKKHEITALIRPNTASHRLEGIDSDVRLVEIDLANTRSLKAYLAENSFDAILHIGAIRGGRKYSKQTYYKVNVDATEQLMINAQQNKSKFIFCSSVGVFGAIPPQVPANNKTERQPDTYYHYTKIYAEKLLQKYVLYNLNAAIVRPSITYGVGDYGFPYTLIKLIDKKMLFLPNKTVSIHLANVELVTSAFLKLLDMDYKPGSAYNVADKNPVSLQDLADFINQELHNKSYPRNRRISPKIFHFLEKKASKLNSDLWKNRFALISHDWFYEVDQTYQDLGLKQVETLPAFKYVVRWYLDRKRKS